MASATFEQIRSNEWDRLDDEAAAFGVRHVERLKLCLSQGALFPLSDITKGIREKILAELEANNPDRMVVPYNVFSRFRYEAGIAASLIDVETVRGAAGGSVMWDNIIESPLGSEVYDGLADAYALTEERAAKIFARDYAETAAGRLMGRQLIYALDEGEL